MQQENRPEKDAEETTAKSATTSRRWTKDGIAGPLCITADEIRPGLASVGCRDYQERPLRSSRSD